jgi:hypothetical protein
MTPEEKAKISRENGAKSRGPKSPQGKARSSRNALKTGEYSEKFKHFIPPHEACIANEERKDYEALVDQLIAIYKPANQLALDAVGDIAVARWQIRRFEACITMTWNLSLAAATRRPNTFAPELVEIKVMVDATAELLSGNSVLIKLNREIARLQQLISRAERRIKFVHQNFPDSPEQTQPDPPPPVENTPLTGDKPGDCNPRPAPVYTSECTQTVIDGYRKLYPGRPIVILPPETGADGPDSVPDHTPVPRIEV